MFDYVGKCIRGIFFWMNKQSLGEFFSYLFCCSLCRSNENRKLASCYEVLLTALFITRRRRVICISAQTCLSPAALLPVCQLNASQHSVFVSLLWLVSEWSTNRESDCLVSNDTFTKRAHIMDEQGDLAPSLICCVAAADMWSASRTWYWKRAVWDAGGKLLRLFCVFSVLNTKCHLSILISFQRSGWLWSWSCNDLVFNLRQGKWGGVAQQQIKTSVV